MFSAVRLRAASSFNSSAAAVLKGAQGSQPRPPFRKRGPFLSTVFFFFLLTSWQDDSILILKEDGVKGESETISDCTLNWLTESGPAHVRWVKGKGFWFGLCIAKTLLFSRTFIPDRRFSASMIKDITRKGTYFICDWLTAFAGPNQETNSLVFSRARQWAFPTWAHNISCWKADAQHDF